jgi:transposase
LIVNEGLTLSKVSKKLKLKLTTARLILKKYKETGAFPMRNFKKKMVKSEKTDESLQIKQEQ